MKRNKRDRHPAFVETTAGKGGEYMIKKISIATGIFVVAVVATANVAFAQTATPSSTTAPTVTTAPTSGVVPSAAPATGRAR